jgi:hypothetical protein
MALPFQLVLRITAGIPGMPELHDPAALSMAKQTA